MKWINGKWRVFGLRQTPNLIAEFVQLCEKLALVKTKNFLHLFSITAIFAFQWKLSIQDSPGCFVAKSWAVGGLRTDNIETIKVSDQLCKSLQLSKNQQTCTKIISLFLKELKRFRPDYTVYLVNLTNCYSRNETKNLTRALSFFSEDKVAGVVYFAIFVGFFVREKIATTPRISHMLSHVLLHLFNSGIFYPMCIPKFSLTVSVCASV